MRSRRHHRHPHRTAADIDHQLSESITAHVLLVIIAVGITAGAAVRLFLGGGWITWLVLVFAALASAQGAINLRRLQSLRTRLRADPSEADRIHAIPRVPFLQGWFKS